MPEPIATLTMVNLDSGDPVALTNFYAKVLGWTVAYADEDYGMIRNDSGTTIGFGRIDDYRSPTWPDSHGTKRYHLDLQVGELEKAKDELVELGATVADPQPGPGKWLVMLDPQGHPLCLVAKGADESP
jgi:predicted enzyme related to lactoylglutathione lyase